MNFAKKLLFLLNKKEKNKLFKLFILVVIMALFDVAGIASLIPFISLISNEKLIFENFLLSFFYNYLGFSNVQSFLIFLGSFFLLLVVFSILIKGYTTYSLNRFWQFRRASITTRLLTGYLNQSYAWFITKNSSYLKNNIFTEVDEVVSTGLGSLLNFIAQTIVSFSILITLFLVSPIISITIFIIISVIYSIIIKYTSKALLKYGKNKINTHKKMHFVVGEAFGAFKEIKLGGLENLYSKEYQLAALNKSNYSSIAQAISITPRFFLEIVVIICFVFVTMFLYITNNGSLSKILPILSIFIYGTFKLMPALQQAYQSFSKLKFVFPSVDLIFSEFRKLSTNAINYDDHKDLKLSLNKGIKLENLSFSYPNTSKETIKNINLFIEAKSTVGFVGETGSGKSTTVDLILGLLRYKKGKIEIDDNDINKLDIRSWQKNIGYVPQHIFLADASIEQNIAFGIDEKKINLEQVILVSKIANLHGYVSKLSLGYKTIVGERGVRLSGGQRQRIAIARALYSNPEVLVLDEATSSLDNITEKSVMEDINNLGKSITIIIIAHRLSTIRKCDKIYLFENGKINDQGDYDYLSKYNENFKNMIRSEF